MEYLSNKISDSTIVVYTLVFIREKTGQLSQFVTSLINPLPDRNDCPLIFDTCRYLLILTLALEVLSSFFSLICYFFALQLQWGVQLSLMSSPTNWTFSFRFCIMFS